MSDETPQRQMSLIPYPNEARDVVLSVPSLSSSTNDFLRNRDRRRGNAVVVFDAESRQLQIGDASQQGVKLADCPYCHRPLREGFQPDREHDEDDETFDHRPSFVDPEYFRMLAQSRHASPESSGHSTPRRRFFQPALRSGNSRNVSLSDPPTGAEFVGSAPAPTESGHGISSSAFLPGYFKRFFEQERELGRGGKGVVLLVKHIMDGVYLGHFACKRVPVGNDHDWLKKVLVEVTLLQGLHHMNIVSYQWVWLEDYQPSSFGPSIPCLWILQEYCNSGDLHDYVLGPTEIASTNENLKERARRRSKGQPEVPNDLGGRSKMTFDEIFSFFRDITSGLHHLHGKGYIHRDLKPSNCLLHRDGSKLRVLISDFGEVQAANAARGSTGATGTISYCAPEVLRRDAPDGAFGNFTTKSDIFSLGMIVYFMCFGRLPYRNADDVNEENEDLDQLRAEITAWTGFNEDTRTRDDLPERLYRFLKRLLSVDPAERPSTEEILKGIRAGARFEELTDPVVEDASRISAADTPIRRPSHVRKASTTLVRPGLSSLARNHARSRSPMKRDSSEDRPTSPLESSIVMRPRKVELPPPSTVTEPQLSPRLMLPPPPPETRWVTNMTRFVNQPPSILTVRSVLFVCKLISLSYPCSPYALNAWLFYPLLCLAALDLGVLPFRWRQSLLLLGLHTMVFSVALQRARLCAVVWKDF